MTVYKHHLAHAAVVCSVCVCCCNCMDPSDWRLNVIVNHLTDFWTFFFCFVSLCDSQLLFFSLLCVCPSSSSTSSLCLSCCPSSPLQPPLPLHVRPFWSMVVALETLRLNPRLVLTEAVALVIQASFFSCFLSAPTCFYCICFLWSFTNLFVDLFILATGILSVPFGRTSYFFAWLHLLKHATELLWCRYLQQLQISTCLHASWSHLKDL